MKLKQPETAASAGFVTFAGRSKNSGTPQDNRSGQSFGKFWRKQADFPCRLMFFTGATRSRAKDKKPLPAMKRERQGKGRKTVFE
jgi:hypothetical protein